ncbi:MAG: DJ-1/PfpI family protein [bacterium]
MAELKGKKALMIIAERNFRDEELLKPRKILADQGVKVTIASTSLQNVRGMLGATVKPDILLSSVEVQDYDVIIFVGGSGASQYWNDPLAHSIAQATVENHKILGAICIAPVTLANAGVLSGKKATVFSSEISKLEAKGAIYTGKPVQVEGKIITGEGPKAAEQFGEAIVKALESLSE